MKSNKWYRQEVANLTAILNNSDDSIVARRYVIEKLNCILDESGVSLHPRLENAAKRFYDMVK